MAAGWQARDFRAFAAAHRWLTFELTPIGCGLAGYQHSDIAPMFVGASDNIKQPAEFLAVLQSSETPNV